MTREHIVVAAAVGLLIVASPLYVRRVGDFAVPDGRFAPGSTRRSGVAASWFGQFLGELLKGLSAPAADGRGEGIQEAVAGPDGDRGVVHFGRV
jgi:hypothetical protein